MAKFPKIKLGIDTAAADFVVDSNGTDATFKCSKFANNEVGIAKFIAQLNPSKHHVIVEATGAYSMKICYELHANKIAVSLINPRQIASFSKMLLLTAKNDDIDARTISMYGDKMESELRLFTPKEDKVLKINQKRKWVNSLINTRTRISNQIHALERHPVIDEDTLDQMNTFVAQLTTKIKAIEAEVCQLSSDAFKAQLDLLTSIKSIGPKTAIALIIATNGFQDFKSSKQFNRFIGICPTYKYSGKSVKRKGPISRSGDPEMRRLLYMAAMTAVSCNAACKEQFKRLKKRGKQGKIPMVAVMSKLVRQAFAVVRKNEKYNDGFTTEKVAKYKNN